MKQHSWTEEETATLISLHRAGVSYGKIAAALGMTLNMATGKISRLIDKGVLENRLTGTRAVPEPVEVSHGLRRYPAQGMTLDHLPSLAIAVALPTAPPAAPSQHRPTTCCYPLHGDARPVRRPRFCGAGVKRGSSYCDEHDKLCIEKRVAVGYWRVPAERTAPRVDLSHRDEVMNP